VAPDKETREILREIYRGQSAIQADVAAIKRDVAANKDRSIRVAEDLADIQQDVAVLKDRSKDCKDQAGMTAGQQKGLYATAAAALLALISEAISKL